MSLTNTSQTILLDTGRSGWVDAVAFQPDGKHLLGGNHDGIRRWRLADGQEVGKQTGMDLNAISVSSDHKWIVCGTYRQGASVWDGAMRQKVIDMEGKDKVFAVDVSPDSTRCATGTDNNASIWDLTTGKRLIGPLQHDAEVNGVRFSPTGKHFATACHANLIHTFDSYTGDKLMTINTIIPRWVAATPLAWSSDAQQIFAACSDNKIRSFNISTGLQLTESHILHDGINNVPSLAANSKFIATFADHSISLLDPSTLTLIAPVIEDSERISSIAISLDSSHLATGRADGKIVIRDLSKILLNSYGPFHTSADVEVRQGEQSPRSGGHDDQPPDPTLQEPGKSSPLESGGHSGDDDDLLELEPRPSTPAEFDYDESLSLASSAREDEILPVGSSHVIPQPSNTPPVPSIPQARAQQDLETVVSSHGRSIFKKWLQRKSNKNPTSHELNRLPGKSHRPGNHRSPSRSPSRADATNEGPSWMAAGKRKRRAVAKTVRRPQDKSSAKTTVPKPPNRDASRSGQGSTGANEAGPAQQSNDLSQAEAAGVHLTHREASGYATLSLTFPAWLLCFRSGTHDEAHLSS